MTEADGNIRVTFDDSLIPQMLDEATTLLLKHPLDVPKELVDRLLSGANAGFDFGLEFDPTTRTLEIRPQVPQGFLESMTALRALDIERSATVESK